jgi:YD repeat-containing protein
MPPNQDQNPDPRVQSQEPPTQPGDRDNPTQATPAAADVALTVPWQQQQATGRVRVTESVPISDLHIPGYEILAELGHGGMGIVYSARQVALKRLVALKMIRAGADAGPQDLERFRTEAEAAARLQHPNIVQIHEVGEQEGRPFFSMEFVDGGSLATRLYGQPQEPREAARLVETLAQAMHYAHQRGVVHRDLKPANVLLSFSRDPGGHVPAVLARGAQLGDAVPKISDFGLAKQLDADSARTRTGVILGTPSYMAPEQALGNSKQIGPACDIYALGAILYELLTGRPPFKAGTMLETMDQVRSRDPVPPRQLQAAVPRDLETICLKCLRKEPTRRYASAQELADDLHRFLRHEPIRARPASVLERTSKWVRRHPAATLAGLAVILLVIAGSIGFHLWRQNEGQRKDIDETRRKEEENEQARLEAERVKIEYYANYVKRHGVPEGIGPISEEQMARRERTFKFYRRGGKVEQVDSINGRGEPSTEPGIEALLGQDERQTKGVISTDLPGKIWSMRYKRDADGHLSEEAAYDRAGQVVRRLHFTSPNTAHYTDANGFAVARVASGASYVQFVWSPEGFEQEVWFLNRTGQRKPDQKGVAGHRHVLDARGLPLETVHLGVNGQPVIDKEGIGRIRRRFDERGNDTEHAWFGAADKPVRGTEGYHKWMAEYDVAGNRTATAYFDIDGRPGRHNEGNHKWTARYNERGDEVERNYFGTEGQPAPLTSGVAAFRCRYDDHGNRVEQSYFGVDGQPTRHKEGNHKWTCRYDGQGNVLERAYFDSDGKPTRLTTGVARFTAKYDEHGNQVEQAYFGVDGKPARHKDGNHKWTKKFDDRGNELEFAYWDIDDKPMRHSDGLHRRTQRYDERGNEIERRFFGPDGKPTTLVQEGMAVGKFKYDEWGNQIETAYFGVDDEPVRHKDGNHRWTAKYDENGRQTELAYWGTDGLPVLHRNGFHRRTTAYDDRNDPIEEAYFGVNDRPVVLPDGYARRKLGYDERGRIVQEAFFDADKRPVRHRAGFHKVSTRRDDRGNIVEIAFLDTNGLPVQNTAGVAKIETTYDPQDKPTGRTIWVLDAHNAYARVLQKMDQENRQMEDSLVGADGKQTLYREGHYKVRNRFDERGNRVEIAFLGKDGKPFQPDGLFARVTFSYDEGNKPTGRRNWFLDSKNVYIEQLRKENKQERLLEESYFFDKDKPALTREGFHKATIRFDTQGKPVATAFFDREGKPTLSADGYHKRTVTYRDAEGASEETYFGVDGKPVLGRRGYARLKRIFGGPGLQTGLEAFDLEGKPVRLEVVIREIIPGSQADRLGILVGDVVISYGGQEIANEAQLIGLKRGERPGDALRNFVVRRKDKTHSFDVAPGMLGVKLDHRAAARAPD